MSTIIVSSEKLAIKRDFLILLIPLYLEICFQNILTHKTICFFDIFWDSVTVNILRLTWKHIYFSLSLSNVRAIKERKCKFTLIEHMLSSRYYSGHFCTCSLTITHGRYYFLFFRLENKFRLAKLSNLDLSSPNYKTQAFIFFCFIFGLFLLLKILWLCKYGAADAIDYLRKI